MAEQTYRIRVGTVTTAHNGWTTSRQVPEFSVRGMNPQHAARIARDVMLAAAEYPDATRVCFGMLDEADEYFTEVEAFRLA